MKPRYSNVFLTLTCCVATFTTACGQDATVSFSRDVMPILSDRCFHCHGPDASNRQAELRLDLHDEATADRDGHAAVVPGNPDASEIVKRIVSTDPDLLMPPRDSHRKPLSPDEIQIVQQWIREGAVWGKHWAFEKPERVPPPIADVHPVDAFVMQRLKKQNLQLAAPAESHTLLRRLSFDLNGLPPTPEQVAAFQQNPTQEAFAAEVDRLLKSPHYGERMAMFWLDAARYSDTDGYQSDATRTNWPWRDWVVQAFNSNMTFDQFALQQFAGDLLPNATAEQQLATCFHRNHMTNGEGGRDPEESRVDYVIDRVNTVGTVWLGLTLGCCQCHSHKFDPITQHDYYRMSAFFNSIDEDGKAGTAAKPYLKYKSPLAAQAVQQAEAVVRERQEWKKQTLEKATADFEDWLPIQQQLVRNGFQAWHSLHPKELSTAEGTVLKLWDAVSESVAGSSGEEPTGGETGTNAETSAASDNIIQASGPNPFQDDYRIVASTTLSRVTGLKLEVFPDDAVHGWTGRGRTGQFILTDVKLQVRRQGSSQVKDIDFDSAVASAERDAKTRQYGLIKDTLDDDPRNGWMLNEADAKSPQVAVFALKQPLILQADEELSFVMLHRSTDGDANIARFRLSVTDQPGPAVRSLKPMPLEQLATWTSSRKSATADTTPDAASESISGELRKALLEQFLSDHAAYQRVQSALQDAERQLADFKKAAGELNVMVLAERPEARKTFVLQRGVWDTHGDEVAAGFPSAVLDVPAAVNGDAQAAEPSGTPATYSRMDLAKWITSPDNPLTARVIVNHLWQILFGNGLVRTPDDFGLQGERPTHPELLDWLAVELMEHNWDLQHVIRLIVTSQTYQQSSAVTASLAELDPDNRLLARQTRFRLPSWMIRDAALTYSGLLNASIGGPPVMPYQPEGVWEETFMGRFTYQPSVGPLQYRRTLYAFWRRSSAPTFLFDSAQRRVCEVGRRQTNTPLQALTLLNDETSLESARRLAQAAQQQSTLPTEQIAHMFEHVLLRQPDPRESSILQQKFETALTLYQQDSAQTRELLSIGQFDLSQATTDNSDITVDPSLRRRELQQAALMTVASMLLNLDETISRE
jgi:hypothetical protein